MLLESCCALASSSSICTLSSSMFSFSAHVFPSMFFWVSLKSCRRTSRACSVSCEFWIRKRFCSSSCVKISSSWRGSVKYMSSSCPDEVSGSSSTFGRAGIFGGGREPAAFAAFLLLPALISASMSACSFAAHSSANRFLLASHAAIRASIRSCRRVACRSFFLSFWSSTNSLGVSESRNCLYLRQSSNASLCFDMSLCTTWIAWFSFLISWTLSCLSFVSFSAFLIASCAFLSFSLRNVSKRIASSSSICWGRARREA
mmetsp:Transcript_102916/g.295072  ORF Transcript_102916/g.295072 Transcript_102916/m.295072 type:complete len:259 (+) Transcript_102916:614-1390(+)